MQSSACSSSEATSTIEGYLDFKKTATAAQRYLFLKINQDAMSMLPGFKEELEEVQEEARNMMELQNPGWSKQPAMVHEVV